jgi:hypothetical protein
VSNLCVGVVSWVSGYEYYAGWAVRLSICNVTFVVARRVAVGAGQGERVVGAARSERRDKVGVAQEEIQFLFECLVRKLGRGEVESHFDTCSGFA